MSVRAVAEALGCGLFLVSRASQHHPFPRLPTVHNRRCRRPPTSTSVTVAAWPTRTTGCTPPSCPPSRSIGGDRSSATTPRCAARSSLPSSPSSSDSTDSDAAVTVDRALARARRVLPDPTRPPRARHADRWDHLRPPRPRRGAGHDIDVEAILTRFTASSLDASSSSTRPQPPALTRFATSSDVSPIIDLGDGSSATARNGRGTAACSARRTRRFGGVRASGRAGALRGAEHARRTRSTSSAHGRARSTSPAGSPTCSSSRGRVGVTDDVATADAPGFPGMVSALYAGDELVAAHLGMASERGLALLVPGVLARVRRLLAGHHSAADDGRARVLDRRSRHRSRHRDRRATRTGWRTPRSGRHRLSRADRRCTAPSAVWATPPSTRFDGRSRCGPWSAGLATWSNAFDE